MKKIYKFALCVLAAFSITCAYASESGFDDVKDNQETVLYPNPSSEYVNIASSLEITKIEVRTINGNVVFETLVDAKSYNLDVTSWKRGQYVVTIFHQGRYEIKRITIR